MGRKYIQGRKLFWASLALILILVVLPASLGLAYWWNDNVAGTPVTAWRLNNNTLGADYGWANSGVLLSYRFYADANHIYDLSPFWANETGKDDEILFPSYTENTSYTDSVYIVLNLSASKVLSENMDKLIIDFHGLSNTINQTHITIKIQKHKPASSSDIYSLITNGVVSIANGTLHYEQKLDPAVMSYAKSTFETTTYSDIVINIAAINTGDVIFPSNGIVTFKIYTQHPHGNVVIGSYDFMTTMIWFFTVGGIFVLLVTSPAWNPTRHNGLIDKLINRAKYAYRKKSHTSHSRHRSHRSHSSHRRRTTHHRRRR